MPFPFMAAAVIGSSLVSAISGSSAASKAAKASEAATQQSLALQREQWQQAQANQRPYLEAGYSAIDPLQAHLGLGGGSAGGTDWAAYAAQPDVQANWAAMSPQEQAQFGGDPAQFGQWHQGQTNRDASAFVTQPSAATGGFQYGARPDPGARPAVDPVQTAQRPTTAPYDPGQRPAIQQPAAYQAPTYTAPTAGGSPAITAPPTGGNAGAGIAGAAAGVGARPTVGTYSEGARPTVAAPDFSIENFQQDPGYQYRIDQGINQVAASGAFKGALNSGAALKSAVRLAGNEADQTYDRWRNFGQNAYQYDRTQTGNEFDNTANRNLAGWQTTQGLQQSGYTADADRASGDARAYAQIGLGQQQLSAENWYRQNALTQSAYQFDTGQNSENARYFAGLNSSNALAYAGLNNSNAQYFAGLGQDAYNQDANRSLNASQFDATRSDQNFNFDQSFTEDARRYDTSLQQQNYNADRAYGFDAYNTDFNNSRGVYNDRTNALLSMMGIGQGSAQSIANLGQSYASNSGNALMSNAATQGNAAMAQSNLLSGALNNGVNALSYFYGGQGGSPAGGASYGYSPTNPAYRGMGPYG